MHLKGFTHSYRQAQILKTGNLEIKHLRRKIESVFLAFPITACLKIKIKTKTNKNHHHQKTPFGHLSQLRPQHSALSFCNFLFKKVN